MTLAKLDAWAPVTRIVGALTQGFAFVMLLPAIVEYFSKTGKSEDALVFFLCACFTFFCGYIIAQTHRFGNEKIKLKQAFLATTLSWIALSFFGSLPFMFTSLNLSFTDALFETISGLTTTGSTVLTGLDDMSKGILFWRSLTQWLGGLGVIVLSLAAFPALRLGGFQLFKAEAFSTPDQILPRATLIAGQIALFYVAGSFICMLGYIAVGMSGFDAINHAMTTIATGGMSTHDDSFGYFNNVKIEMIAIIFMIYGSLPFALYVQFFAGRFRALFADSQVRFFLILLVVFSSIIWGYQLYQGTPSDQKTVMESLFNITSIMTGTGYATTDYTLWGSFSVTLFFIIMFIGGCAASTSCGVKIFRVQVVIEVVRRYAYQMIYPNGVFSMRFNGRILPSDVATSVIHFFIVYFFSFLVLAGALNLTGLDTITALSGAGTAISNVGPGLGEVIGPAGNFQPLPDSAKWILSFGMLLGRLELFAILIFFLPSFWRE